MPIIVQKFGGTSIQNVERIKHVSGIIKSEIEKGSKVIVVVSAMAGITDRLVSMAREVSALSQRPQHMEYDSIICSGENVSSGLLALKLMEDGIRARSWQSWQLPILTDDNSGHGKIKHIQTKLLLESIKNGEVPIVTGFQGICNERLVTLGRGGSDTTAAAIAASVKAQRCDIYTDVDGIFTADPRLVPNAKKLDSITYEEMLEMSSAGAKVIHPRAVEIAIRYNMKMRVLSSYSRGSGTTLIDENKTMEKQLITGITCSDNEAKITIKGVANKVGIGATILAPISDSGINIMMAMQDVANDNKKTDLCITVSKNDTDTVMKLIKRFEGELFEEITEDTKIARVSVIGIGMRSTPGIAQKLFEILANKDINILGVSTSEVKISILLRPEDMNLAVRSLHTAYGF